MFIRDNKYIKTDTCAVVHLWIVDKGEARILLFDAKCTIIVIINCCVLYVY